MARLNEKEESLKFKALIEKEASQINKTINIMEVCGTHTMAISRFGIRAMLPLNVKLLSGPGCPVCVTPIEEIDRAVQIAETDNTIITTFGDMMRVPGTNETLSSVKSSGADVRIVYSVTDALETAEKNPGKQVVFLGIGFETTSPSVAMAVKDAKKKNIKNFSVLPEFKVIIPPMEALLSDKELNIQGFLAPGHASSIVGGRVYEYITEKYKVPCVVAGFEPLDILQSVLMILVQIRSGNIKPEIQYTRAVRYEGNKTALAVMEEVYTSADSNWRGIGMIPASGLTFSEGYKEFNALARFSTDISGSKEPAGCMCGDVLKGKVIPSECPLFGKTCTPANPVGACMVSAEGSCSAYYKYERNV